jgi:SAM-dependent methyltransferase
LNYAKQLKPVDVAAPELGTVWDLCLSAEYDRSLAVRGLADWLGPPDHLKVLDCACGSGFPSHDLYHLGYDLTCTDASPAMLDRFRRKAREADVDIKPLQAYWEELESLYPARFDVVMCRGSSLIYAGTWDSNADPDWSALEASVKNFVGCLRPGGRIYVDTTHEEDLLVDDPAWEKHEPRVIDGHQFEMQERVVGDQKAGVRRWMVQLQIDGESFDFERKSHYLPHSELISLLEDAGLEDVARAEVSGERYAVFSGRKP